MIEPYVRADGTVYQPEVKPEQLKAIGKPARRRTSLGAEFRERARHARERREAEAAKEKQ